MRNRGFTLLELLVALAIFAVLSTLAYGGLKSMLDARNQVAAEAEKLARLQTALAMIERDLEQATARPIRDQYGVRQPAMAGTSGLEQVLEWTRSGWNNPAGRLRSNLQRVAYRLEDDGLQRLTWSDLDRLSDTKPATQVILGGVKLFKVEFLDDQDKWIDHWPAQNITGPPLTQVQVNELLASLPRAVNLSLEITDWGNINRIFLVKGR